MSIKDNIYNEIKNQKLEYGLEHGWLDISARLIRRLRHPTPPITF